MHFASREDFDGAHPLMTLVEYEGYNEQLDKLRRVCDRDLPQLLRAARGLVANDAEEEIAHIQRDQAVVDARSDTASLELPNGRTETLTILGVSPAALASAA